MNSRRAYVLAASTLLCGLAAAACGSDSSGGTETLCNDGRDNDWDQLVDCADPDCATSAACGGSSVEAICYDGRDNDGDQLVDCDDPDCASYAACGGVLGETDCADGLDNDSDGSTDCEDRDCVGTPACPGGGTCSLGTCCYANTTTMSLPVDTVSGQLTSTDQMNGPRGTGYYMDDIEFEGTAGDAVTIEITAGSFDTYLYLLDESCQTLDWDDDSGSGTLSQLEYTPLYTGVYTIVVTSFGSSTTGTYTLQLTSSTATYEVVCDDYVDNDLDGYVDCDDPDCYATSACLGYETDCSDYIDNDGDGDVDCADGDCYADPACERYETDCADYVDNDSDGYVDCDDPDCLGDPDCAPAVETDCADYADNDLDGYTDCADPDCVGNANCDTYESICYDEFDNDGDGYTDCYDSDCLGDPNCPSPVEVDCSDGADNDSDTYTDCSDPDCMYALNCIACSLGSCCLANTNVLTLPGDSISGSLDTADQLGGPRGSTYYHDDYEFSGTAGQTVTIELTVGSFDTYLYLLDGGCETLTYNDDGGSGTLSLISSYTLPYTGVYTIAVTSYSSSYTGTYTLQLAAN
jgi:hypothetical protein